MATATVPQNITDDLTALATALDTVASDNAAVATAVAGLAGDQTTVNTANATLAADTTTANGLYSTLLTDLAAWDAGGAPAPAVQAFRAAMKKLADKHKALVAAKPKALNWGGLLTIITEILQILGSLTPPAPAPVSAGAPGRITP